MENKVGTVFLDFDGVITNSAKRAIEMLNIKFNMNNKTNIHNFYNLGDLFPKIKRQDMDDMFNDKEFFNEQLEIFDDFLETVEENKDIFNFTIVTLGNNENLRNKEDWCDEKLPSHIEYVGVPIWRDKSVVDMSGMIMIDDNLDILMKTNAKIKILFVPEDYRKYNTIKPYDSVYVVHTWKQVNDILSFYGRINQII